MAPQALTSSGFFGLVPELPPISPSPLERFGSYTTSKSGALRSAIEAPDDPRMGVLGSLPEAPRRARTPTAGGRPGVCFRGMNFSARFLLCSLFLPLSFGFSSCTSPPSAETSVPATSFPLATEDLVVRAVAFGSCLDQDKPAPILRSVQAANPDLVLLLGDNIYADTLDMGKMRADYQTLADAPDFARLRSTVPILATWDDHDYGANDAGAEFPARESSKEEFLRFFGSEEGDPRRTHAGIYDARTFGPEGRRTQVILLDTRTFRGPLTPRVAPGPGRWAPNPDPQAELLGEAQWEWLEKQLRTPAQLRLLVSSIQVISAEHGWETWGNFPDERQRLFDLIRSTRAEGVLILSGDRHMAEISVLDGPEWSGYDLYDVTSSSFNRPGGGSTEEPNRHRRGQVFQDPNFGWIEIDWEVVGRPLTLEILDTGGESVSALRIALSDLRF